MNNRPPNINFGRMPSHIAVGLAMSTGVSSTLRFVRWTLAFAALTLGAVSVFSQDTPKASNSSVATRAPLKIALIKSFRIIQEEDGPALELLSTHPLTPRIKLMENPTRLVIDFQHARIDMAEKRIDVQADQITTVLANQARETPPVARVVVDLLAPRTYKWEAIGNRLVVHLGKNPGAESQSPFEPPTVPSLRPAPQPVIKAVRATGPLAVASGTASVGSSFTAGADTAVLSLSSGGELRVCPGTTVSITPSTDRHNLMLGMNTGAIETHTELDASADLVMTPDFRIALRGPGECHYAISTDNRGDTCVRALPGNEVSATATELMGDGIYQTKATDQVVFRGGRLDRVDMNVPLECGCPPPRGNIERAQNALAKTTVSEARPPADANPLPVADALPLRDRTMTGVPAAKTGTLPAEDIHVEVTAPLVFHASGPPPAPVEDVGAAQIAADPGATRRNGGADTSTTTMPLKPMAVVIAAQEPHRGFLRRIGGFFARIFR